jgi:antitoxin component YwqK of YwqJK toxin-antitoxin module
MKYLVLTILLLFLFSCGNDEAKKPEKGAPESLVEVKNGIYYEWYPGKKQIKYKGGQDKNKKRNGIWTFYSENGTELSVTYYENGLKEGFSVVKYPTGVIHYRGEYRKDKTVGIWTTYDEKGKVISETDFGYTEEE